MTLYVIMEDACSTTMFLNASAIQVSKGLDVKLRKQVSGLENDKQYSSILSFNFNQQNREISYFLFTGYTGIVFIGLGGFICFMVLCALVVFIRRRTINHTEMSFELDEKTSDIPRTITFKEVHY